MAIVIAAEGSSVRDADGIESGEDQTVLKEVIGARWNSYVCKPGAIRTLPVPGENQAAYRYYVLKILSADGNQGKVKIADFGLRTSNDSYAGFVRLNEGLPE